MVAEGRHVGGATAVEAGGLRDRDVSGELQDGQRAAVGARHGTDGEDVGHVERGRDLAGVALPRRQRDLVGAIACHACHRPVRG